MQKTKLQIIEETAQFYNLSNRGQRGSLHVCEYLTPAGNKCAVGRCMDEEKLVGIVKTGLGAVSNMNFNQIEDALKPEYAGHDAFFWRELQTFHDDRLNFTDEGLTPKGEQVISYLKAFFQ